MAPVVYASAAEAAAGQDKGMGFEVDLLAKYMVTENVSPAGRLRLPGRRRFLRRERGRPLRRHRLTRW